MLSNEGVKRNWGEDRLIDRHSDIAKGGKRGLGPRDRFKGGSKPSSGSFSLNDAEFHFLQTNPDLKP